MMKKETAMKIETLRANYDGISLPYEWIRDLCYKCNTNFELMKKYGVIVKDRVQVEEEWISDDELEDLETDDEYRDYVKWDDEKEMWHYYQEIQLWKII